MERKKSHIYKESKANMEKLKRKGVEDLIKHYHFISSGLTSTTISCFFPYPIAHV